MALHPALPRSPYQVLDPAHRWFPANEALRASSYERVLPPLVARIREQVKAWRDSGYAGASETSRALLRWWFNNEHVVKMATGAGKTKVLSLLIASSFFHRLYESGSLLSRNFLLIAPNIIVLDRLRADFDGLRIFFKDPVLPDNGHGGRNWRDYFLQPFGERPSGKTTDSRVDLGELIREIDELAVFNDEAHHIHDERMAWRAPA